MISLDTGSIDLASSRLSTEEGFRSRLYVDTKGKRTIGYGFNVDAGISENAARALMAAQLEDNFHALSDTWWWGALDPVRASVILDMAFNMGAHGLLGFPKMLAAIGAKAWGTAAEELLDSDAARDLPGRYGKLAKITESGQA